MSTEIALSKPDNSYLTDPNKFEHLWRVAKAFSLSTLMPETIRGKPEDCFILAQLSMRLNVDLFMLAQNTYVVHGRPGMEAKLQIGLLNASGRIRGNIAYQFDGEGDAYGCCAVVTDAMTGEKIIGPKVDKRMVKAEGWDKPKGNQPSKWQTMPEMMFRYRAASLLIRAHYPEVTLGLLTREELEEQIIDVDSRLSTPALLGQSKSEAIAAMVAKPADAPTAQDQAETAPRRRGRPPKAKAEQVAAEPTPEPETEPGAAPEPQQPESEPEEPFDEPAAIQRWETAVNRAANQIDLQGVWHDINDLPEYKLVSDAGKTRLNETLNRRWSELA
jgi:hypothetical protein